MCHGYTETVCAASPQYTRAAVYRAFTIGDNMPVRYGDTIATIRRRLGLTQADLAERLNVEQPTVQRWESGTREPNMTKLADIASALGVDPGDLFGAGFVPLGPKLFVKGEVAAGVWREAFEWPEDEWQSFTGRADVTAEMQHRFGLRVVGSSMNEVYPEGTVVECVSVFGRAEIQPGKRVVVLQKRIDGAIEATVKELQEDSDGRLWAIPRSTNPSFQALNLSEPEGGIAEVRVIAVVVASYRPE
jgi:transcriptional regulator with XRE-family HTH domain